MKVYEALEQLKAEGPIYPDVQGKLGAICGEVQRRLDEGQERRTYDEHDSLYQWNLHNFDAFAAWEYFSGRNCYPVPHPDHMDVPYRPGMFGYEQAQQYWIRAYDNDQLWAGRYGELRMMLLDHLIQWFKERGI